MFDLDILSPQPDGRDRPLLPAREPNMHFLNEEEALFDHEPLFKYRYDQHIVFFPHRRRLGHRAADGHTLNREFFNLQRDVERLLTLGNSLPQTNALDWHRSFAEMRNFLNDWNRLTGLRFVSSPIHDLVKTKPVAFSSRTNSGN